MESPLNHKTNMCVCVCVWVWPLSGAQVSRWASTQVSSVSVGAAEAAGVLRRAALVDVLTAGHLLLEGEARRTQTAETAQRVVTRGAAAYLTVLALVLIWTYRHTQGQRSGRFPQLCSLSARGPHQRSGDFNQQSPASVTDRQTPHTGWWENTNTHTHTHTHTHTQRETHAHTQDDGKTLTPHTGWWENTNTHRHTGWWENTNLTHTHTHTHTQRDTHTKDDGKTLTSQTHTERDTHTHTHRDTHTQRYMHPHTHTQRDRQVKVSHRRTGSTGSAAGIPVDSCTCSRPPDSDSRADSDDSPHTRPCLTHTHIS